MKIVDDAYVGELADAVTGSLGGKVGVAPRVFLKELVTDVLERVEQFADFDPRRPYALTLAASELSEVERNAAALAVRARRLGVMTAVSYEMCVVTRPWSVSESLREKNYQLRRDLADSLRSS